MSECGEGVRVACYLRPSVFSIITILREGAAVKVNKKTKTVPKKYT